MVLFSFRNISFWTACIYELNGKEMDKKEIPFSSFFLILSFQGVLYIKPWLNRFRSTYYLLPWTKRKEFFFNVSIWKNLLLLPYWSLLQKLFWSGRSEWNRDSEKRKKIPWRRRESHEKAILENRYFMDMLQRNRRLIDGTYSWSLMQSSEDIWFPVHEKDVKIREMMVKKRTWVEIEWKRKRSNQLKCRDKFFWFLKSENHNFSWVNCFWKFLFLVFTSLIFKLMIFWKDKSWKLMMRIQPSNPAWEKKDPRQFSHHQTQRIVSESVLGKDSGTEKAKWKENEDWKRMRIEKEWGWKENEDWECGRKWVSFRFRIFERGGERYHQERGNERWRRWNHILLQVKSVPIIWFTPRFFFGLFFLSVTIATTFSPSFLLNSS